MTNYKKDTTPLPPELSNITESRRSNFSEGTQGAGSNWDATVAGVTDFAKDKHDYGYFVPYLGTGMLASDAYEDAKKGDWGGAALNAGLAALNVVPFGSIISGAVKGAKAVTKVATKSAPKVFKSTPKSQYPNLKPSSNKPIKVKDIDPEAPSVKGLPKGPKKPAGGILKPKGNKGAFLRGAATAYLAGEVLEDATAGAGVGGVTDQQLSGAVTRSAAFQVGASR